MDEKGAMLIIRVKVSSRKEADDFRDKLGDFLKNDLRVDNNINMLFDINFPECRREGLNA
jgi:hypothetical protein